MDEFNQTMKGVEGFSYKIDEFNNEFDFERHTSNVNLLLHQSPRRTFLRCSQLSHHTTRACEEQKTETTARDPSIMKNS
jgi:hypothetical protein